MTTRSLAVLLVKLWGLSRLVSGVIAFINAGLSRFGPQAVADDASTTFFMMSSMLGGVINLLLGAALLFFAQSLASALVSGVDEMSGSFLQVRPVELQRIVFAGIAMVLGINALRSIGQLTYAIARAPAWDETGMFESLLSNHQEQLVGAVVQLGFAIALFVGRQRLSSRLESSTHEATESDAP